MAYFRTGGGIPAALKSAMNAVLNKKFGTAKTYEPNDWPDDVNLLGMLEEKTVSSASVCSFSDGADDVPMSSVIAHISPTLTGKNAVNMVQAGKNLADYSTFVDGYVNANGTFNINHPMGEMRSLFIPVKPSTQYYFSIIETSGTSDAWVGIGHYSSDSIDGFIKRTGFWSFTTDANAKFIVVSSRNLAQATKIQLEEGTTFTTYEPYQEEDYTANLGQAVYGGQADIVNGIGTETHKGYNLGSLTWSGGIIGGQSWCWFCDLSADGLRLPENSAIFDGICDDYTPIRYNGVSGTTDTIALRDNGYLYVNNGSDTITPTGNVTIALATGTSFTFDGQEIPSLLGVNNLWHDAGDTEAVYRSSGTVTPVPVVPTLISKTITENGTYSAEDDDADGYSEVTVNVQGGATPFVPQFTETLIADNTAHASSFTLTEDYGNYDMVKIVWYESASSSGFLYTTPDILDEIFSIGVGKLCVNKPSTNYYACYTKSGLTWTRSNQRVIDVHEIYGVTFTNCTMTATDLYKRGASTTDKHAVTSQTSLKDYDLFMMSSIQATDGSETMPTTWLYQYPPENMSEAFSCPVPAVLQEYNANDEAFVISEYGMTAARYFMVQGIKFTSVVGEESDPNQVNELVENDEEVIPEQLNEVVENDETEQEGENDAR